LWVTKNPWQFGFTFDFIDEYSDHVFLDLKIMFFETLFFDVFRNTYFGIQKMGSNFFVYETKCTTTFSRMLSDL
jgi:hypothetical protein